MVVPNQTSDQINSPLHPHGHGIRKVVCKKKCQRWYQWKQAVMPYIISDCIHLWSNHFHWLILAPPLRAYPLEGDRKWPWLFGPETLHLWRCFGQDWRIFVRGEQEGQRSKVCGGILSNGKGFCKLQIGIPFLGGLKVIRWQLGKGLHKWYNTIHLSSMRNTCGSFLGFSPSSATRFLAVATTLVATHGAKRILNRFKGLLQLWKRACQVQMIFCCTNRLRVLTTWYTSEA